MASRQAPSYLPRIVAPTMRGNADSRSPTDGPPRAALENALNSALSAAVRRSPRATLTTSGPNSARTEPLPARDGGRTRTTVARFARSAGVSAAITIPDPVLLLDSRGVATQARASLLSTAFSVAALAPWKWGKMARLRARQIAVAGVLGAGGAAATGVLTAGLLVGQVLMARRTIPQAESPPPRCDGRYGTEYPGDAITVAVLGDSSAAGYGVQRARDTLGALLATGITEAVKRPVRLRCYAMVGATSQGLAYQVERYLANPAQLAVVLIGVNDITHWTGEAQSVRHLTAAVRELQASGAEVVVGTCPDLGAVRPIRPPLRWLARRWCRQLAAAQTMAVVEAGGRTVSLGDLLGPQFDADPLTMFAADRFHPSEQGYAAAAAAILPTALAALAAGGLAGAQEAAPSTRLSLARGEGVRTLQQAATEAASQAGTEVSAVTVAGKERGPGGRWAELRHRIRQTVLVPREPAAAPGGPSATPAASDGPAVDAREAACAPLPTAVE
jgi:lysophospholipase L1-like esterase